MVRRIRLYRALLWLYPAEFREEYGEQMEITLQDRLDRANKSHERIAVCLASVLVGFKIHDCSQHHILGIKAKTSLTSVHFPFEHKLLLHS